MCTCPSLCPISPLALTIRHEQIKRKKEQKEHAGENRRELYKEAKTGTGAPGNPVVDCVLTTQGNSIPKGVPWACVKLAVNGSLLRAPASVHVVGHQVNEVQVLIESRDVICVVGGAGSNADRGGQKQRRPARACALCIEGSSKLPQQRCKVGLVRSTATTANEAWVLPVKVKAIKAPGPAEIDGRVHELLAVLARAHHVREDVLRPAGIEARHAARALRILAGRQVEGPAADGDQRLQVRMGCLKTQRKQQRTFLLWTWFPYFFLLKASAQDARTTHTFESFLQALRSFTCS